MYKRIPFTLDADLAASDTLDLGFIDKITISDAGHRAFANGTRFDSPTDFTIESDPDTSVGTLTWLSGTTLPAGTVLIIGVAMMDTIAFGLDGGGGGGGGGAVTIANGAFVPFGSTGDSDWDGIAANPTFMAMIRAYVRDYLTNTDPAEVTSPAPSKVTATITNGTSLSAGIAVRGAVAAIKMPAGWTAAAMTFQGSIDGGASYANIYDDGTERTIASGNIVSGRVLNLSLVNWIGYTHIKIRSGTSAAPVNQLADRNIDVGLSG